MGSFLHDAVAVFFEYDTPKIVHIRSKTVGCMNRLIQLTIVVYVIAYVIVLQKGYQEFSDIDSSVTSKLKGVVYTDYENITSEYPEAYKRIWDVADYVVPSQENGAFFVMTNMVITPNQTQGTCAEDPSIKPCNDARDCAKGVATQNGNGVMTGNCVVQKGNQSCEIYAWCDVEIDTLPLGIKTAVLQDSKNFTVLLKNSIEFPMWKIRTRNILENTNLKCTFDSKTDPTCPIFRLETIVNEAGQDYNELAVSGGVIAITIHWECNLDFNVKNCIPVYSFRRLDDPNAKLSPGWNFRYAQYHEYDRRTLYKAYGIRFVTFVQGRGGKFSIIPLLLNIGSGLALLSIAVIICDVIVLYLLKNRSYYKENKYQMVHESDDSAGIEEPVTDRNQPSKYRTFQNNDSDT